ncbi:MAG TPA: RHS repeat-associated core domain-containing protein [Anaerolineales bacterium]|nr:RHS repeat-associated core domain-containing protein [Anaerolineales bacterium]
MTTKWRNACVNSKCIIRLFSDFKFQTDARGCVTNIAYDELNRPTGKTYSGCPATGAVTYAYDAGTNGKGRRTSMGVTGADFTQWTYDARGRVTSENKQITGGGQFVTAFTYNDADLPVTMTYPDSEVVTFEYNNNMLPVSVSGTDTYAQTIAYDSANRMIQMIRGANKINTVFTYNNWNVDNGRLQNITSTQVSTGDPLQNLTYDYDSVSNIETIVDSLSGTQTQTFTYDALDRLTNSSVTGGTDGLYTEGYTYEDPNNPNTGNLFSKNGVTYTYSTTHKHAVTSLSNGNTYGYDQNGNMTSRHVFEGTQFKDYTLNYDAENRLVSVTGAATASFVYDGDGKQIKATVNGITAVYVGNHYEVKNSIVTKYYFAGSTRIAVRKDGTLNFLLSDHIGSSSVTTNANGAKTASALYKAFGETRYTLGSLNTDYKFTGQREEASLGIYFFNARWFDGSLGRFLSPDTIVPTSTQGTQAWDRYAFVNNNPVRYNDPTGHEILPFNTFFISATFSLNAIIPGWQGGFGMAIDLRPFQTFKENTINDGSLNVNKLFEELGRLANDLSMGFYSVTGWEASVGLGVDVSAAGGVSTKTMEEWEGTSTIVQELNANGEICSGVCLGASATDIIATENIIDTFALSIGAGEGINIGLDVVTHTEWIRVYCHGEDHANYDECAQ